MSQSSNSKCHCNEPSKELHRCERCKKPCCDTCSEKSEDSMHYHKDNFKHLCKGEGLYANVN